MKTRQGNEGEIKKEQGLTVAQGLLYPPPEGSLQEMNGNAAEESKVRHADDIQKKIISQLLFFCQCVDLKLLTLQLCFIIIETSWRLRLAPGDLDSHKGGYVGGEYF